MILTLACVWVARAYRVFLKELGMKRLYVVDPDHSFIDFLKEALEDYCVEGAKSGLVALQAINENPPDIIVTELWLIDINGLDFIESLITDPKTKNIPVIVCSAASLELRKNRNTLTMLGVKTVEKPFDLNAFSQLVDSLIGKEDSSSASGADCA